MLEQADLKLVRDERQEGDPIPLERRIDHRRPMQGRVTAVMTAGDEEPRRHRICSLDLRDQSEGGLGAVCLDELPLGSSVTVFFPPHGPERGFDLYGTVVWCGKMDDGFEIGIQLARQKSACA